MNLTSKTWMLGFLFKTHMFGLEDFRFLVSDSKYFVCHGLKDFFRRDGLGDGMCVAPRLLRGKCTSFTFYVWALDFADFSSSGFYWFGLLIFLPWIHNFCFWTQKRRFVFKKFGFTLKLPCFKLKFMYHFFTISEIDTALFCFGIIFCKIKIKSLGNFKFDSFIQKQWVLGKV